jgi:hypothetical protein
MKELKNFKAKQLEQLAQIEAQQLIERELDKKLHKEEELKKLNQLAVNAQLKVVKGLSHQLKEIVEDAKMKD